MIVSVGGVCAPIRMITVHGIFTSDLQLKANDRVLTGLGQENHCLGKWEAFFDRIGNIRQEEKEETLDGGGLGI